MFRFLAILLTGLFFSVQSFSQTYTDISQLAGKWEGQLTYADFKDDKSKVQVGIELETVWKNGKMHFNYLFKEANGKEVEGKRVLLLKEGADEVNFDGHWDITEYDSHSRGWDMALERHGEDNNRKCDLMEKFVFRKDELVMEKWVKYEGEEEFFMRNHYQLARVQ